MYKSLQACRAVAACLVVLFHLGETVSIDKYYGIPILAYPFSFGHAGVEFFFVLSGFIIFFIHSKDIGHSGEAKSFALKRVIRIFPSYWLVLFPLLIVGALVPGLVAAMPQNGGVFLKTLFLIPQDSAIIGGTGAPVVAVAWTLQYELVFYGLFLLAIVHRAFAWLIPIAMIGLYFFSWERNGLPWMLFKDGWMLVFLLGCLTAWLSRKACPRPLAIASASLGLLGFAASAAVRLAQHGLFTGSHFAFGLSSALIIYGLVQLERRGAQLSGGRLFQLLGAASYVLYLIHVPVIIVTLRCFRLVHWNGMAAALTAAAGTFIVCLAASIAFHLYLEKPVGKFLSRRFLKSSAS